MRRITFSVILLTLLAACAVAGPVITPVKPSATVTPIDPTRVPSGCIVGNDGMSEWIVDFVAPPQKYALIFDVDENTCRECPLGFRILTLHVVLQTDGPCEFSMDAILMTVQGAPGACYTPAAAYCGSQSYVVAIPDAGLWDVGLQVACACADSDYPFALKVDFESACAEGGVPMLVTDGAPTACRNYVLGAGGWEDLVQVHQFPGNLLFWGEAECCSSPVGQETGSWGGVKAIYR